MAHLHVLMAFSHQFTVSQLPAHNIMVSIVTKMDSNYSITHKFQANLEQSTLWDGKTMFSADSSTKINDLKLEDGNAMNL